MDKGDSDTYMDIEKDCIRFICEEMGRKRKRTRQMRRRPMHRGGWKFATRSFADEHLLGAALSRSFIIDEALLVDFVAGFSCEPVMGAPITVEAGK